MAEDTWIMHGMSWDNPYRIRSPRELINWVNEIGFLPLFRNSIPGFSAEEHVSDLFWWTGDPEQDPWEWRAIIAESGEVAYGRFFGRKNGFVSLAWLPVLANYRRDGYDFDARWEDAKASRRAKKIMDCFEDGQAHTGLELKRMAGFGKDGEKNFDGIMNDLQMQTYLVTKGFRRKVSRQGTEYGMPVCVYARPEDLWGPELIAWGYREDPEISRQKLFAKVRKHFGAASDQTLLRELK